MEIQLTSFDGLKTVKFFTLRDDRGTFAKPWLSGELASDFGNASEAYFSSSQAGVLRGLHFQLGSFAQKKYVSCLHGMIEDIAVDIRPNSATYGQTFRTTMKGLDGRGVIVPEGFAHGIYAYEFSIIVNFCDKPYAPGEEGGINCKTVDAIRDLNITNLSEKDITLPPYSTIIK